jgi:hypothetical protein
MHEGETNGEGKPHGHGMRMYTSGTEYIGEFVDGARQGHGVLKYADGAGKYEGQWKGNKRHGHGKLTKKGYTYEGEWLDNEYDGYEKKTLSCGTERLYRDGEIIKKVKKSDAVAIQKAVGLVTFAVENAKEHAHTMEIARVLKT